MSVTYEHLLSPVRVGGMTLKNRLISANSLPHFLQGPEPFPAEPVINHVVTMAKNGAAADTYMIGDCFRVGNLHTCSRGAFSVVNNL